MPAGPPFITFTVPLLMFCDHAVPPLPIFAEPLLHEKMGGSGGCQEVAAWAANGSISGMGRARGHSGEAGCEPSRS